MVYLLEILTIQTKLLGILVEHIGGVYFDDVKGLIHNADYFSIFCDGSTDRSDTEKEVIFVKCLEDYYPK